MKGVLLLVDLHNVVTVQEPSVSVLCVWERLVKDVQQGKAGVKNVSKIKHCFLLINFTCFICNLVKRVK